MAGKKYQSCLVPFENEILALRRRKPPMPFPQIAEYLKEKHQISVRRQTIETFLKIRMKGYKPCKYAWNIEPINDVNQPTTEVPSLPKQTVLEAQETPTQLVADKPSIPIEPKKVFKIQYSDVYNLTRLSDEEAAERREKESMNEEPENTRQMETNRAFEHPIPLPAGVHDDNVLQQIQNIIAKNGRFDYLSIYDIPIISRYFFDKIKELGCKRDGENRSYCTDPAVVLKIVKAVHTLDEEKGKKFLSKIMEA